jgi:hypothetical protein
MQFQVLDDLISGKLVAWGMRDGAPIEEGPIPIPAHLFPRGGEDTAEIDWDSSALSSSGYSFNRIRVAKPVRNNPRRTKAEPPTASREATPPAPLEPRSIKKKGRPSVDEPLRAIVRTLREAHQLLDISRKEQIEIIRAAARVAHPTLFLKETQPSRDKIFSALRAEGLIGSK